MNMEEHERIKGFREEDWTAWDIRGDGRNASELWIGETACFLERRTVPRMMDIPMAAGWGLMAGPMMGPLVMKLRNDIHSHHVWAGNRDGSTDTAEMSTRVEWLLEYMSVSGVQRMALSGLYKWDGGGPALERPFQFEELDDTVEQAAVDYPDAFIPFVRGFPLSDAYMSTEEMVEYIQGKLEDDGFRGIGEVIARGHGDDCTDVERLKAICDVAIAFNTTHTEYSVPVLFHWDLGAVDAGGSSIDTNWDDFQELLDHVAASGFNVNIILGHCGTGPGGASLERDRIDAYLEKLDYMLDTYPRLYFDIAGMCHVPSYDLYDPLGPTDLGSAIAERIRTWPDRFILGFDVENYNSTEYIDPAMERYTGDIVFYEMFREECGATRGGDLERWNAKRVFEPFTFSLGVPPESDPKV